MSKFLQATNLTWSNSTATSVFQNCSVIHCDNGYYKTRHHTYCAGFSTYEALWQLSYKAPYLGPERGRHGRPTQAVRHTSSGKLGIVKTLRYIRSDMYTASSTNQKLLCITQSPNSPNTVLHRSHTETVKLVQKRADRAVITDKIM